MKRLSCFLTVLSVALLTSAACAPPTVKPGVVRVMFVDKSASTTDQISHWLDATRVRLVDQLDYGTTVLIYGVSDRTSERAAIYEGTVPPRGDGMLEEAHSRAALHQIKTDILERVREFLSQGTPSGSTEILRAIRLIPSASSRPVEAIYLTDGLESAGAINLETTVIDDPRDLARRAGDEYKLVPGSLKGVTVSVVLDSPAPGRPRHVNSRERLEAFFRALFEERLGARIASFNANAGLTLLGGGR
jgi:hypothetical protein